MGYFKTIPKELEECARIDGATRFGAMVRIIFPIAVPGILSAGIFAFTLSWNEFIYALVFHTIQRRAPRSALILYSPPFRTPFCTWLLMGYFKTIPKELEECARIDGATRFGAMLRII